MSELSMSHCIAWLLTAWAAAGAGELEITNPRTTYGQMGATRPKTGHMPGDSVFFAFNIKNLTPNKEGQVEFTTLVEVFDPKDELLYAQGPRQQLVQNYFGGNVVPYHAEMVLPIGAEPGTHSVRVTVADKISGKKVSFTGKGHVLTPDFSIVRLGTFGDGNRARAPLGAVGEMLQVKFSLIHFGRDKKGMSDLGVSLKVLDEKKAPLAAAKTQKHVLREAVAEKDFLPLQLGLILDRPGRFFMEISARDNVTGKMSTVHLPLRVLEPE
jgi:hypothetical protein